MWTLCPVTLDAPVKILGLEPEDFLCAAITPLLASVVLDTLPSFGCGALVGLGFYGAKRGQASGALLHWLHGMQLARLPGVLGPTPQRYSPW
jgi:hypothetical protein